MTNPTSQTAVPKTAEPSVGGQVDEVLNQRVWLGCFPFRFKGGEAAFARIVAFVEEK